MNCRKLVVIIVSLLTLSCLFGTSLPTLAKDKGELVWVSYGGGRYGKSQRIAFFDPFTKETGIKTVGTAWGAEYSKLKAMVKSGKVEWDLVEVTPSILRLGIKEGLFEPLDYKIIKVDPNDFHEKALTPYGIASIYWPTMLMYNSELYPGKSHPNSWADFWNVEKFPGPRSLEDTPRGNLEFALLADGVPKDKLYPLDIDRAFKKLDEIKPYITVWWSQGALPPRLVSTQQVVMSSVWIGRWWTAMQEGAPVNATFNEAAMEVDYWVIPKGAKNKENAMKFLAWYVNRPDRHAWHAKDFNVGVGPKKADNYLDKQTLAHLPTAPENFKKEFVINDKWWTENLEEVTERWQLWKLE